MSVCKKKLDLCEIQPMERIADVSHLPSPRYECPSLVQVPTEGGPKDGELSWVLIISINPGARVGGSETQYVPGDWNGTHFTAHDSATRFIDFGKDNYAGIPYHNTGSNKTIFQAWASNWQYTQVSNQREVYDRPSLADPSLCSLNCFTLPGRSNLSMEIRSIYRKRDLNEVHPLHS